MNLQCLRAPFSPTNPPIPLPQVRQEGLQRLSSILSAAKFIKGDVGELPAAIAARMNDTNKNLALEALKLAAAMAQALGPHTKPHTRTTVPGLLQAMGDSKVRACVLNSFY